jgi:predicted CoA-binding protein
MPLKLFEKSKQTLKNAKTILLVDWASTDVPFSLLKAGFTVYSYSPGAYALAQIVLPDGDDSNTTKEKLIFTDLNEKPNKVDIVNVFRPEEEHAAIITDHVLPLEAKVLWLHPPIMSVKTNQLALAYGVGFIEGVDIVEIAQRIIEENNRY